MFKYLIKKIRRKVALSKVNIFTLPEPGEKKYKKYFFLKKGDAVEIILHGSEYVEGVFYSISREEINIGVSDTILDKFSNYQRRGSRLSFFLEDVYGIEKISFDELSKT